MTCAAFDATATAPQHQSGQASVLCRTSVHPATGNPDRREARGSMRKESISSAPAVRSAPRSMYWRQRTRRSPTIIVICDFDKREQLLPAGREILPDAAILHFSAQIVRHAGDETCVPDSTGRRIATRWFSAIKMTR